MQPPPCQLKTECRHALARRHEKAGAEYIVNKLRRTLFILTLTIACTMILSTACGDDENDEPPFSESLPTIEFNLTREPENPGIPSTPTFDTSLNTPEVTTADTPAPTNTAYPTPTFVPLKFSNPAATPLAQQRTPAAPQNPGAFVPSTEPPANTTPRKHTEFPTPDVPAGIGAPPLPPAFPAAPDRPTPTQPPPTPIFIELDDDDPINAASWYQDGLTQIELDAIHLLREIADPRNITIEGWLDMPAFKTSIEPADINALKSLITVKRLNRIAYWYSMLHPTIRNGIYDEWTNIISTLPGSIVEGGKTTPQPRIINQLLNPEVVSMELDTLLLPSGTTVQLAIIRTAAGDLNSMQRLKDAIIRAEDVTGETFPQPHVSLLFAQWPEDSTIGGQFHRSSITISKRFDVGLGSPDAKNADRLMQRLVTRYYPGPIFDDQQQQADQVTPTNTPTIAPTIDWGELLPPTRTPAPTRNHEGE